MVKLFVARLDYSVTEEELSKVFDRFGKVKLSIPKDKETGKSRGFAFVEIFADDAQGIMNATDGLSVNGREISVKLAEDKKPGNSSHPNRENGQRGRSFEKKEYPPRQPRKEADGADKREEKTDFPFNREATHKPNSDSLSLSDKVHKKKDNKVKKHGGDKLSDGNRKLKMSAYKKNNRGGFMGFDDDDDY